MNRRIISFAVITLLFASALAPSCKKEKQSDMIVIPMNVANREIFNIDLSRCDTILLDTSKQALMYQIDQILFGENEICIQGRGKVSLFTYNGSYIRDIGTKGRGPGEFLNIGNLYKQNNQYFIFDWEAKKNLKYDEKGNFINDRWLPAEKILSISKLYPLDKDNFVTLNTYTGVKNKIPTLSVYNSSFNRVSSSDRMRSSGDFHIVPFQKWENEILFSDYLCDTLYSITPEGTIKPKYRLDFGEYAIPGTINGSSDLRRRLEYVNRPENLNKVAAILLPATQDDKYLYIYYYFQEGKVYLLRYNKQTGDSQSYKLWDPHNQKDVQFTYFTVHNNMIYFVLNANKDEIDNPLIVCARLE